MKYTGIKLYLKNTVLVNGFYDVVGYYGSTITPVDGSTITDFTYNGLVYDIADQPVILAGLDYYICVYNRESGFSEVIQITDKSELHTLTEGTSYVIYEGTPDDANLVSSSAYPINQNIHIKDITALQAAWRYYTIEVTDKGYAILITDGTIYDPFQLVESSVGTLTLEPQNEDALSMNPEPGNVLILKNFVGTYTKFSSVSLNTDCNKPILLYDYETSQVVTAVNDVNITISGNMISFSLAAEIDLAGTYFLYIPTRKFILNGTDSSRITMLQYTISGEGGEDGPWAVDILPAAGESMTQFALVFKNQSSVSLGGRSYALKYYDLANPTGATTVSNFASYCTVLSNKIFVSLPSGPSNNTSIEKTYRLEIDSGLVSANGSSSPGLFLEYKLLSKGSSIGVSNDYQITVNPSAGLLLSYLQNVSIKFTLSDSRASVALNPFMELSSVIMYRIEGGNKTSLDSFESVSRNGNTFTFVYPNRITEYGNYEISIPQGFFYVNDGTAISKAISSTFTIAGLGVEDTLSTFYFQLVKLSSANNVALGTRPSWDGVKLDSIYVRKVDDLKVLFQPVITVRNYSPDNNLQLISYEAYNPTEFDTVTVRLEYKYYDEKYYLQDVITELTYGSLNEWNILDEVPKECRWIECEVTIFLNDITLIRHFELHFLDPYLYDAVARMSDPFTFKIQEKMDLNSLELVKTYFGSPVLTGYEVIQEKLLTDSRTGVLAYRKVAELVGNTKIRMGNLDGIFNETFGNKLPEGFGFYGLSVYLTGNFYLDNGMSMMDLSDRVTIATGDTKRALERLESLDHLIQQSALNLKDNIQLVKDGISAHIGNYISSNKDSIFRMGLDYSLWALGNAGISLINPNVTYQQSANGDLVPDPATVGDGDEYIELQGESVNIKTYATKKDTAGNTLYKIIWTRHNPASWVYRQNAPFVPCLLQDDGSYTEVEFKVAYISQSILSHSELRYTITNSNEKENIMRYAAFNAMVSETGTFIAEQYGKKVLSFNSGIRTSSLTVGENSEETYPIYAVQDIEMAAMFKNGRINSNLVTVKTLVATKEGNYNDDFDYNLEMQKEVMDEEGNIITPGNWPILDEDLPYALIDGQTGAFRANLAVLKGSLTVGEDGRERIVIEQHEDPNKPGNQYGGIFIYDEDNDEIAEFSGRTNLTPLDIFNGAGAYIYNPKGNDWTYSVSKSASSSLPTVTETQNVRTSECHVISNLFTVKSEGSIKVNTCLDIKQITGTPKFAYYSAYIGQYYNFEVQVLMTCSCTIALYKLGSVDDNVTEPSSLINKITGGNRKTVYSVHNSTNGVITNLNRTGLVAVDPGKYVFVLEIELYTYTNLVLRTLDEDLFYMRARDEIDNSIAIFEDNPDLFETSANVSFSMSFVLKSFSATFANNAYKSTIFGNGMLVGFDKDNNFAAYYSGQKNSMNRQMIIQMKAGGTGFKYSIDGVTLFYKGFEFRLPITVFAGFFRYKNDESKRVVWTQYGSGGSWDPSGTGQIDQVNVKNMDWETRKVVVKNCKNTYTVLPAFQPSMANEDFYPIVGCSVAQQAGEDRGRALVLLGPSWNKYFGSFYLYNSFITLTPGHRLDGNTVTDTSVYATYLGNSVDDLNVLNLLISLQDDSSMNAGEFYLKIEVFPQQAY